MSIFNKLAGLFVEYEEVDEDEDANETQEEVEKNEPEEKVQEEKLARKVELPKNIFKAYQEKREEREQEEQREKEREIEEEVSKEEPVNILKEKRTTSYFDDYEEKEETPEEEEVKVEETKVEPEEEKTYSRVKMFDDKDFYDVNNFQVENKENEESEEDSNLYSGPAIVEQVTKETTTYTKTYYHKPVSKFVPSPIISPVYGILDKNYKKEEIISKKDSHVSSSYEKADLDVARSKLLGSNKTEEKIEKKDKENVEEKEVVDTNKSKPSVNKITIGDADEYYKDLGLEYNVDYQDNSKNAETRVQKREEKKDDNLFDLIDSMYKKEE